MNTLAPPTVPEVTENPWRTVLEFQLGSGPDLKERRRHRDQSLVFGLASGVTAGLTVGVLFFSFLYWLTR